MSLIYEVKGVQHPKDVKKSCFICILLFINFGIFVCFLQKLCFSLVIFRCKHLRLAKFKIT